MRRRIPSVAMGLVVLVLAAVYSRTAQPGPSRFNVVIVSIDTLRADHLGCYGYDRKTSPRIDELASQGVRFSRCIAQSSWTLPSHASLLSGTYPSGHGAITEDAGIAPSVTLLSSVLKEAGYQTEAVVSSPLVGERHGFNTGFDSFLSLPDPILDNSRRVNEEAIDRLNRLSKAGRPFFLFLHYLGPHVPYDPPPPLSDLFDPDYQGDADGTHETLGKYIGTHVQCPARDLEHIVSLYDGEILDIDESMAKLGEAIRSLGIQGETLFLIVSDHGEEFGEHLEMDHGRSLYQEVMTVPWIMICPGYLATNKVLDGMVQLVDVMPTLCDLLGIPKPNGLQGTSLAPLLRGCMFAKKRFSPPEYAYAELTKGKTLHRPYSMKAVWNQKGEKLIITTEPDTRVELYELERDPGEKNNVADEDPRLRDALRDHLASWSRSVSPVQEVSTAATLTEEQKKTLSTLGYLARSGARSDPSSAAVDQALNQPRGVCVARDGRFVVADFRNHRIAFMDPSLSISFAMGGPTPGTEPGQFSEPCDVKVDERGDMVVADSLNGRIQRLGPGGEIKAIWGGLFAPRGIALSSDGSRVYVTETGRGLVHVFTNEGKELVRWGGLGDAEGQMDTPVGIAVDQDGDVWVAERGNARVQIFTPEGKTKGIWPIESWKAVECLDSEPYLALSPQGQVALSDPGNDRILIYGQDGKPVSAAAGCAGLPLKRPSGVAWLSDGRILVSDTWNHRIVLLSPADFKPF